MTRGEEEMRLGGDANSHRSLHQRRVSLSLIGYMIPLVWLINDPGPADDLVPFATAKPPILAVHVGVAQTEESVCALIEGFTEQRVSPSIDCAPFDNGSDDASISHIRVQPVRIGSGGGRTTGPTKRSMAPPAGE
jgi:hypothetical protein